MKIYGLDTCLQDRVLIKPLYNKTLMSRIVLFVNLTLDFDNAKTMIEQNKQAQNYTDKPRICAGCCHYQSKIEHIDTEYGPITEESERKCGIGGFTITMQGTCDLHNKTVPQIADGFMQHTTIEYGAVINVTDGPYSGLWESTKGGWIKKD